LIQVVIEDAESGKGMVSKGMVSKGMVSKGMVSKGMVSKVMVGKGMVSKGMVGKGMVGKGMVGKGIFSNDLGFRGSGQFFQAFRRAVSALVRPQGRQNQQSDCDQGVGLQVGQGGLACDGPPDPLRSRAPVSGI
jgi:hypothetical protein